MDDPWGSWGGMSEQTESLDLSKVMERFKLEAQAARRASDARLEPTPRQLEACRAVAADLNPFGLYLLGLDFIGEHLTEINITSPTCIRELDRIYNLNIAAILMDCIEQKLAV